MWPRCPVGQAGPGSDRAHDTDFGEFLGSHGTHGFFELYSRFLEEGGKRQTAMICTSIIRQKSVSKHDGGVYSDNLVPEAVFHSCESSLGPTLAS
ncbi:hypothetical protein K0M31_016199 [Melipona bicolor]|uniref:Uncharacterized protein n=1 Tax=Melipona bicolor TaxID=60889 RepID=A0AA40G6M6_9HYME|nr:hypothetical protein K0M31_016199 [Melipona bicolor]